MGDEVLEKMVRAYLKLKFPSSGFAWQGGEPTLMGLDFYKKAIELQERYGFDGQVVSNSLQTNGVLLDDEWCAFLKEYNFLVGISLDGPKEYHDHYRVDRAGKGTFDRVMAAVEKCRRHGVEFNILVLLNDKNVVAADKLFDFFMGEEIKFLQFVPCVEKGPAGGKVAGFSITPGQYGDFLCRIFDRWWDYGVEKLSIRIIDSVLHYLVYGVHSNCTFKRKCGDYIVVEHNGDAFCCDFFVDPRYRLGNIIEMPIAELFQGKVKRQFANLKTSIHNKCLICRYCDTCRGGCLKDRIAVNDDLPGPSYFCESYKQFFDHALPLLSQLATEIRPMRENLS